MNQVKTQVGDRILVCNNAGSSAMSVWRWTTTTGTVSPHICVVTGFGTVLGKRCVEYRYTREIDERFLDNCPPCKSDGGYAFRHETKPGKRLPRGWAFSWMKSRS